MNTCCVFLCSRGAAAAPFPEEVQEDSEQKGKHLYVYWFFLSFFLSLIVLDVHRNHKAY